jgi:hypothetical protein
MISSESRPAAGIAKSFVGRPMRKPAMTAILAFVLATAFTFAAAPTAIAAPSIENNGMVTFWEPDQCRGQKPGVCRDYSADQLNQPGMMLPDQQITTHQSPVPRSPSPQR